MSNKPYLFQGSNIVSSNSEHICFGPFKCCATPEIPKKVKIQKSPERHPLLTHHNIH